MKVTYQGPFDAEQIAETGQVVERGGSVEVPKEIAESLLSQGSQTVVDENGEPSIVPAEHPNWIKTTSKRKES